MDNYQQKKSLGQHWLRDETYLTAMCQAADLTEGDSVLEVGPGLGTLTEQLLIITDDIVAVEFDNELAEALAAKLPDIDVRSEDILDFDYSQMKKGYKVVANIPYYLTSHLVRKLLESENQPSVIALLIQKEVAERLAAPAGKMSILSVMAQYYSVVSLHEVVPAEFFDPAPKVDSQIVSLKPKEVLPDIDTNRFFRIVRAGFGERRKKLSNSLAGGMHLPKDIVAKELASIGFRENVRAQELSIDQWLTVYELFNDKMST